MVLVFASSGRRHLSDSVVDSHEVGVFCELGDDFTCMYPLSLTCYCRDRHEALFGGSVHSVGDLIESLCRIPYRRDSRRRLRRSLRFLLRSCRAFLSSLVSSAGALADSLSVDMSSKLRSGRVPEGLGVSSTAMKTWRSGVQRLESVLATSVGVCSSVGGRGVPSWKGSESR
jgi:hypothetical protein